MHAKLLCKRGENPFLVPLAHCDICTVYLTMPELFKFIYLLFYVTFNSQGHTATDSLQVEETSAYCTVNHRASASNYQLSNMKRPARDSNRRLQRLEARTLTTTPPSPLKLFQYRLLMGNNILFLYYYITVHEKVLVIICDDT